MRTLTVLEILIIYIVSSFSGDETKSPIYYDEAPPINVINAVCKGITKLEIEYTMIYRFVPYRDLSLMENTKNLPDFKVYKTRPDLVDKVKAMIQPTVDYVKDKLFNGVADIDRELLKLTENSNEERIEKDIKELDTEFHRLLDDKDHDVDYYKSKKNAFDGVMKFPLLFKRLFERPLRIVNYKDKWNGIDLDYKLTSVGNELYVFTSSALSQEFKRDMRSTLEKATDIRCSKHFQAYLDRLFINFALMSSEFRYVYFVTNNYLLAKFIILEIIIQNKLFISYQERLLKERDLLLIYCPALFQVDILLRDIVWDPNYLSKMSLETIKKLKDGSLIPEIKESLKKD